MIFPHDRFDAIYIRSMSELLQVNSNTITSSHWDDFSEKDKVLIVDDNSNNLQVMSDLLNECGYQVIIAQSGEHALETVSLSLPDIILLDVMMPGISGFETCRRLKENVKSQNIPVLFMTALSDTVNQVKGLSLGAVDYITKPVQHEEALARIRAHLALRRAQTKLMQREKMAALGQMVAGIAHEINNPVNFIHGNLNPAQNYANALLGLVEQYEEHTAPSSTVQEYAEDIDLDFIKKDFVPMLQSMQMGTTRIKNIVQSLRTFSRLDESAQKKADLHAGIDSVILILQSRLEAQTQIKGKQTRHRPKLELVKDYGQLPCLTCYPAKLNQVFMHLIVNAIDALDEKFMALSPEVLPKEKPTLKISTAFNNEQILIRVADNGIGILKENKGKIFDQFFTTKEVGKGTGLGLTVSHSIVTQDHRGYISFRSTENKGSEFMLTLPL